MHRNRSMASPPTAQPADLPTGYIGSAISLPMKLPAAGFEIVERLGVDSLGKQNARLRVLHTLTANADPQWPRPTVRIDRRLGPQAPRHLAEPSDYARGTAR